MALKILKKDESKKEPRLPEGGDRFLWDEIPASAKKVDYAQILKGKKPS